MVEVTTDAAELEGILVAQGSTVDVGLAWGTWDAQERVKCGIEF